MTVLKIPEIYFGAARNNYLGNGRANSNGLQNLSEPSEISTNMLYLAGEWEFQDEFAQNINPGAKIIIRYNAKNVHFVASATNNVTIRVFRDGKPPAAGNDVSIRNGSSIVNIGIYFYFRLNLP